MEFRNNLKNFLLYMYSFYFSYFFFCCVFLVDVILVLDQERVYNDFKNKLGNSVKCVHLPKSGGVRFYFFLSPFSSASCHTLVYISINQRGGCLVSSLSSLCPNGELNALGPPTQNPH